MNEPIAIIPARSGCKRIPLKNIKGFCGKPVIACSIETAKQFFCFVISACSQKEESIGHDCKAKKTPHPLLELADCLAVATAVLTQTLNRDVANERLPDNKGLFYVPAIFFRLGCLRTGLELIYSRIVDVVFSVTMVAWSILRDMKNMSASMAIIFWPDGRLTCSLGLSDIAHDAEQSSLDNMKQFLQFRQVFSERTSPVRSLRRIVQDVNGKETWSRAWLVCEGLRSLHFST